MRKELVLLTVLMGLFLSLIALVAFYLDPSEGKVIAAAVMSIVPSLVTFYFSNEKSSDTVNLTTVDIKPRARKYRVPDSMSLSILMVTVIIYANFLLEVFDANIEDIRITGNQFIETQVAAIGIIWLGIIFPISAIWATRVGYRPLPVKLKSAMLAVSITIGMLSLVSFINSVQTGGYIAEPLLHALFSPNDTDPLPTRGKWVMAAFTLGSTLVAILFIGLWLWSWTKFGGWRFRRRYSVQF